MRKRDTGNPASRELDHAVRRPQCGRAMKPLPHRVPPRRRRTQVVRLPKCAAERLEALAAMTGASSAGEALEDAMHLAIVVARHRAKGGMFPLLPDAAGNIAHLIIVGTGNDCSTPS